MRLAKITITICLMLLSVSATTYGQGVVKRQQQSKPATQGSTGTVKKNPQVTVTSGEYVDLGLPSGTLWATKNIGANKPEEYGDYFAWGETKPKKEYTWETYKWCKGSGHPLPSDSLSKYNPSIAWGKDKKLELDLEDDAAYVNWGSEWRIPSEEQIRELVDYCSWKRVTYRAVKGYKVTGRNGNSLFFPDTFYRSGNTIRNQQMTSEYWSRTILYRFTSSGGWGNPTMAKALTFDNDYVNCSSEYRSHGFQIRPVRI